MHAMDEIYQTEAAKAEQLSATANQTGVDVSDYIGTIKAILSANKVSGTTPTLAVKLQDSDTVGGTYADVTGGAFTTLTDEDGFEAIHVDSRAVKSFLRVVDTLGGTSPVFDRSVVFVGRRFIGGQG